MLSLTRDNVTNVVVVVAVIESYFEDAAVAVAGTSNVAVSVVAVALAQATTLLDVALQSWLFLVAIYSQLRC